MEADNLVLFLFVLTIFGLVRFQRRPDIVFGALTLCLFSTGLVSTKQLIGSFSNEGVLVLVLLICCSFVLEKTKLLSVLSRLVIHKNYKLSFLRLFTLTSLSSAFLNNTAVVSTLLSPVRSNVYHSGSKLLIPLSYSAILGGTLTLVGTSTNLIVNSMVIDANLEPLKFFDFSLIGSVVVIGCGSLLLFLSDRLPSYKLNRVSEEVYFIDTEVQSESNLVGKTVESNGLRNLDSLFLTDIIRDARLISPVSPHEVICENDRLLFSGDIRQVTEIVKFDGLSLFARQSGLPLSNLTEVVVRPDSVLLGRTLKELGFRARFDAAVVAIKRDGETISSKLGDIDLRAGDFLVLAVGKDFRSRNNIKRNFFIISGLEPNHKLTGIREVWSILGFFLSISLSALGVVSLFQSLFVLLGTFLLFGCLSANELMQRLPKQIWIIISGALLLSQAIMNTNALSFVEGLALEYQGFMSPLVGLILVYLVTWLLTELVTNNAAAALMFPLTLMLSISLNANLHSYLLALAFGASASFVSPYGYQTNLMVFNAGQYRLLDFVKVGVPMSIAYGLIVLFSIVHFYGV